MCIKPEHHSPELVTIQAVLSCYFNYYSVMGKPTCFKKSLEESQKKIEVKEKIEVINSTSVFKLQALDKHYYLITSFLKVGSLTLTVQWETLNEELKRSKL